MLSETGSREQSSQSESHADIGQAGAAEQIDQRRLIEQRLVEVVGVGLAAHRIAFDRQLLAVEIGLRDVGEVRNGDLQHAAGLQLRHPVLDDLRHFAVREVLEHMAGADDVDRLVGDGERVNFGAVVMAHRDEAGRRDVLRAEIERISRSASCR
jgi:hypothetical protein